MKHTSGSGDELKRLAADFVYNVTPAVRTATLVALSGELGAGKTTFVQGVAEVLGVKETVASPTFVIEKIYELPREAARGFARLIHIDAYRLKSPHELEALGWKEILADPANLIVLEWPESVPDIIPEDAIRIRIDIEGEGRIISIAYGKKDGEKN